jgi:hypothetical protein
MNRNAAQQTAALQGEEAGEPENKGREGEPREPVDRGNAECVRPLEIRPVEDEQRREREGQGRPDGGLQREKCEHPAPRLGG